MKNKKGEKQKTTMNLEAHLRRGMKESKPREGRWKNLAYEGAEIFAVFIWFEENKPFDYDRDKDSLVSLSTGFISTRDDSVNAEKAAEVGMEMQITLEGLSVTSTTEVKSKVKAISFLRKILIVNEKKIHLDSVKLFNRLIIFAHFRSGIQASKTSQHFQKQV